MAGGRFRKLRDSFRRGGLDMLLDTLAWSVPHSIFYYAHSVLITSDELRWICREHPDFILRFVDGNDFPLLEKLGFTSDKLNSRLEAGDKGVIMTKDGELMTIVWGAVGRRFLKLSGAILDSGDDGFIWYGAYTHEKARRLGLFINASDHIVRAYKAEGRTRSWAMINANNVEWLDSLIEMNCSKVGEVFYFKLLGLNICYYKTWPETRKKIHLFVINPPQNLKWV